MWRRFAITALVTVCATPSITPLAQGKTVRAALTQHGARELAPDFELVDASGAAIRLSGLRGRVVLLDFWATKCGGCIEEIPTFVEIAAAYRTSGLAVLGVSEDILYDGLTGTAQAWSHVKPFVRDHKVSYPVVVDDRDVHRQYNIRALPLTYLVDRQGRIAATYVGIVDRTNLEQNIKALVSEERR